MSHGARSARGSVAHERIRERYPLSGHQAKGERRHQKRYGSRLPRCLSPQYDLRTARYRFLEFHRLAPCRAKSAGGPIFTGNRQASMRDRLTATTFAPFTAQQIEFDELTIRYHFLGDSIKQLKAVVEKNRAEGEERSRLRQLERQKKAAAAARIRSGADSSYCPGENSGKETSRFGQVERKREAAAAVRIDYENNADCWPIDDDDDL